MAIDYTTILLGSKTKEGLRALNEKDERSLLDR